MRSALVAVSVLWAGAALAGCAAASERDAGPSDAGRDASADALLEGTDAPTLDASDASAADVPSDTYSGPAPAAQGCFTSVGAGHHSFPCEGITYEVEISDACALGGCGLIFDVHGATMDAASEDRNTNLRALGSAAGYVVVQPTAPDLGIGPSWDPLTHDPKVFAFLELTQRAMAIDPDRVHFTGFSQGGFMAWRMLCDHADVFASVAPAAACGLLFRGCSFTGIDTPAEEIPVLYVHGSADLIVSSCSLFQSNAVIAGWEMTEDSVVSMDADHRWTRYTSASGNVFEFIGHDYSAYSYTLGGHCLPGSPDIGTNRFGTSGYGCDADSPVTWGEAVLAFFQAHPR